MVQNTRYKMRVVIGIVIGLLQSSTVVEGAKETASKEPPPFFLQDAQDGMCLSGSTFKRCGIDTLFYVVGSPGLYQIHKRNYDLSEEDDVTSSSLSLLKKDETESELCLSKKNCDSYAEIEDLQLTKCTHCGSKQWNILGDANTGYILTENEGKTCLKREKGSLKAQTIPCDTKDVQFINMNLQFANKDDLELMQSSAARFIAAAGDGDLDKVKKYLDQVETVDVRDWDKLTALIPASTGGHLDVVKFLLENGADVNASDKDGITALMEASVMGHVHVVEYLIQNGAQVDEISTSSVTALWLASGEGRTEVVDYLLQQMADISAARGDGISAFMNACMNGHAKTVKALLTHGADILATDKEGLNALAATAEKGSLEVAKILIEDFKNKFDDPDKIHEFVNHASATGFTPLIVATAHSRTSIVEYLLAEFKIDVDYAQPETGVTALMYAAAGGAIDIVKILVQHGANVNHLHSNEASALFEASTAGKPDVVKFLIENGAQAEIVDKDNVSALMSAASVGNSEICFALLDKVKTVLTDKEEFVTFLNRMSHSGGSAVMFAAASGKADIATYFIEHGANYDQQSGATPAYLENLAKAIEEGTVPEGQERHVEGVTGVHVGAQHGFLELMQVFLDAGAKLDVKDAEDRLPLHLAIKGNHGDCAIALVRAGADPNTPYVDDDGDAHNLLMDAIIVENEEYAVLLIEKGADLYYQDDKDVTTLLQASHRGMLNVVSAILDKYDEASKPNFLNIPSKDGVTPLIAASSEGHVTVVERLLQESSIDVNQRDKDGTTSIMAAAAKGHVENVSKLISSKADVNLQNIDGHTALMFAYNGKTQVETLWERYTQYIAENAASEKNDGGTGPIIQEALSNHTKIVEMLMSAGADEKLKDKEGHAAVDFDFHSDLDADVVKQEKKVLEDSSKNEL